MPAIRHNPRHCACRGRAADHSANIWSSWTRYADCHALHQPPFNTPPSSRRCRGPRKDLTIHRQKLEHSFLALPAFSSGFGMLPQIIELWRGFANVVYGDRIYLPVPSRETGYISGNSLRHYGSRASGVAASRAREALQCERNGQCLGCPRELNEPAPADRGRCAGELRSTLAIPAVSRRRQEEMTQGGEAGKHH